MASLLTIPQALSSPTNSSFPPFLRQRKAPSSRLPRTTVPSTVPPVFCTASNGGQNPSPVKVDRRDVLLGLGGLYGASTLTSDSFANAAPIDTPQLVTCGPPIDVPDNIVPTDCCPPSADNVIDFKPQPGQTMRVRQAAHLLDQTQIDKYKRAVQLMKNLPEDDPRSFVQQAKIHCAYCNGSYDQEDQPDVMLQVHNSWLFLPFHRYYIYFYEKILGELIGDPTFGLPFWNYDAPAGMRIPAIFADRTSSLYDEFRNPAHLPSTVIDLDYNGTEPTIDDKTLIANNVQVMNRQMVKTSTTPLLFFGQPYRSGTLPNPGPGQLENVPHGTIHYWTGDNRQPNGEDMGHFYSSGRDPIFYSHHSNIDRLWDIWKTLGKNRKDINEPDYLDTTFLFYNEKAKLVRVKVKDALESTNLGYTYQEVDIPWINPPASAPTPRPQVKKQAGKVSAVRFPFSLKSVTKVEVKRPRKSRSQSEKESEEEVLVIDGIEFDANSPIKFDVFVNNEDDKNLSAGRIECAGSFVNVRHSNSHSKRDTSCLRVGINQLLEDLGAEGEESLIVTLVPRLGSPIIGGVKIQYLK